MPFVIVFVAALLHTFYGRKKLVPARFEILIRDTNLIRTCTCNTVCFKPNKDARNKSLRAQARARRRGDGRCRKHNAPHLIRRVRAGAVRFYTGPRSFLWLVLARCVLQQHGYKAVSSKKKKERHGCIAKVLNWRFCMRESALSLARALIFCQTSIRSL